uniref:Mcm6 C-terminal winged-helix domain-containing protein n=1 Tax=Arundo donax TaxID=35708 RepID=A0A0A9DNW9_ARUDO
MRFKFRGLNLLDVLQSCISTFNYAVSFKLSDMFQCCLFDPGDTGDGLAGMKQGDLIIWYAEQQNAQGAYSNTAEVKEEVKCIKAIIERLIQREGHLIVIDEGTATAAEEGSGARRTSESRILAVNPNYVID